MGRWGSLALVFGVLAVTADAAAETRTLARSGSWEAFGGTTTKGNGVCGISAEPAGRYFGLKLFANVKTFTVQMGTKEWRSIENNAKVPLTLRFDANPVWRATGTGFHFEDGDGGLQFDVNRSEIDTFAREFRDSSQLVIQFENNRFPQWILGLQGTMTVDGAFQTCMRGLK